MKLCARTLHPKERLSKKEAIRVRDRLQRRSVVPVYIYQCRACGRWHLTSMKPKKVAA